MWYDKPMEFWIGIIAAIIVKIRTSESLTPLGAVLTFLGSLLSAIAFSTWVGAAFGLPLELAGAVTALGADIVMRYVLHTLNDPATLKELLFSVLSKGSKK